MTERATTAGPGLSSSPSPPDVPLGPAADPVLQQALEWQVTFWSGEITSHERAEFDRWVERNPAHAGAWEKVQRTNAKLQSLSSPGGGTALRATASPRATNSRRTMLRVIGIVAGAGAAAYAVRQGPQWQSIMADYRTDHGERRELVLPDGSRLLLNTSTALDVRFSLQARNIFLRSGEVFVATAPDPQAGQDLTSRPFTVHTAEGAVHAIGTRFTVRELGGESMTAVEQGAVEIRPLDPAAGATRLNAGQRARFSSTAVQVPAASMAAETAWTRGLLIAERMRLADFLAELGRYRNGLLRCDPAVQDLIVSGVYSVDDTDMALATLEQALPVRIKKVTRYWVTVGARASSETSKKNIRQP